MSRQLRVVLQEAERGFGRLVQTCFECEPDGPQVIEVSRRKPNGRRLVAARADAVIVEVTARCPLDLSWRNDSPLAYNIPVLVCAPSALLVPPSRDRTQILVMPFTVEELLIALTTLTQLTGSPVPVAPSLPL